jgi:hypothetical protein
MFHTSNVCKCLFVQCFLKHSHRHRMHDLSSVKSHSISSSIINQSSGSSSILPFSVPLVRFVSVCSCNVFLKRHSHRRNGPHINVVSVCSRMSSTDIPTGTVYRTCNSVYISPDISIQFHHQSILSISPLGSSSNVCKCLLVHVFLTQTSHRHSELLVHT